MMTNRSGFLRLVIALLAIATSSVFAATAVWTWDAHPTWHQEIVVELCDIGHGDTCVGGIPGDSGNGTNSSQLPVTANPGDTIKAKARAHDPTVGKYPTSGLYSEWAYGEKVFSSATQPTVPPPPSGFWATREDVTVADPVYQGSGTLDYKASTAALTLSSTITNVAVGDLLVVQVQRDTQSDVTGVASTSPALTFSRARRAGVTNGFEQDLWVAIATTAAESMTITASYSSSASWGSMISHRWSGGVTSATPTHTSGHTALQSTSTNRTVPDVTTTARTLILAFGSDWDYYRTHTAATNWTKILDSQTKGTDSTTMFLHARIADAGTYPNGNYATASATDQYFAGIAAFAVDTSGGAIPAIMNQYRQR